MNKKYLKWVLLAGASIIWGTAFLWTKKSLIGLSPLQSAMGRIAVAGIIFLFLGGKHFLQLHKKYYFKFIINGFLGTFIPILLFSIAQTHMDSGITAVFNSVTPLFVAGIAYFVMKQPVSSRQFLGILLGWLAAVSLIFVSSRTHPHQNFTYAVLVFLAGLSYGFDMNLIKKWYRDLDVLTFTSGIFIMLLPVSLLILWSTGFFERIITDETARYSFVYVIIVAVTGSVIAKLMFNKLIQIDTPVFASTVTYLIPVIAVLAGIWDGERIHPAQLILGAVLLYAIYLSGTPKK